MSDNSKNNTIIISIAVIAIIIIAGTAIYFGTTQNNNDNDKKDENTSMTTDATSVEVGGVAMFSNKDLISNAVNAPNLSTLVTAVKAAGLVETLQGPGPFTVFGPDNSSFTKLPAGTVETLLKPENKAQLTSILTYHVVSGRLLAADLTDGRVLKTVQGQNLTVKRSGATVQIVDASGKTVNVLTADVLQSNGVAHIIDSVLLPKS